MEAGLSTRLAGPVVDDPGDVRRGRRPSALVLGAVLALALGLALVVCALLLRDREVLEEAADGATLRPYAATSLNGRHPLWHVEKGSDPVDRVDGTLVKTGDERFHRMVSQDRFGGPGTTLTISYRARVTAFHDTGSSIVAGLKLGLKWPVDAAVTGFDDSDPRSVRGTSTQSDPRSPGSYAFLTGLTERGYVELSRNGYGGVGYEFFPSTELGYTEGTWKDITVEVRWLPDRSIRARYWHNATGEGPPVYDVTDADSPFWDEPAFVWLRTDDADWELDRLTVREDRSLPWAR